MLRCSPRCFALRCSLSDLGLLLHGRQLDDLVLERLAEEIVDDLSLLDGDGEEVDLLERLDLTVLDQTTELGDGHPLLLLVGSPAASSAASASASATAALTASAAASALKAASESA